MNSVPENVYLKTCSNSFPGPQSASLSMLNSTHGMLKVSSCSSTGVSLQRGKWQMPLLLFSHWQLPVCSWQLYSIPKEIVLLPCSGADEKSVIFVASSALDIPWLPFLTEAIITLGSKTWRKLGGINSSYFCCLIFGITLILNTLFDLGFFNTSSQMPRKHCDIRWAAGSQILAGPPAICPWGYGLYIRE